MLLAVPTLILVLIVIFVLVIILILVFVYLALNARRLSGNSDENSASDDSKS